MKGRQILTGVLALGLLLALAVGLSQAQGPEPPEGDANRVSEVEEAARVGSRIPVQGRLTGANGNPLNGTYSIRFRLYDAATEGTALCEYTNSVSVENGLFYSEIWGDCGSDAMNGQQLYLGIKVEDDDEMEDRQAIYPVPYAFSLRPGARIVGSVAGNPALKVENSSTGNSSGVHALASGDTGTTYGVYGQSESIDGYGGYFVGRAWYGLGVALKAAGSGIIQSTANSYLWISGNGLQKGNSDDTTRFVYDQYGGYQVFSGADVSNKGVVLPVTIPGQLYGQDVTVTGLDLYYATGGGFANIDRVVMYRQNGVGAGDQILRDLDDLTCPELAQCSEHWDLTQNNVLSDSQGVVYIAFGLGFSDTSSYVHIGGVRLRLEHD
jgi:hypothetical protein